MLMKYCKKVKGIVKNFGSDSHIIMTVILLYIGIPILLWLFFGMNLNWGELTGALASYVSGGGTLLAILFSVRGMEKQNIRHNKEISENYIKHRTELANVQHQQEEIQRREQCRVHAEKVARYVADFYVDISRYYYATHKYACVTVWGLPDRSVSMKDLILLRIRLGKDDNGQELLLKIEHVYRIAGDAELPQEEFNRMLDDVVVKTRMYCDKITDI